MHAVVHDTPVRVNPTVVVDTGNIMEDRPKDTLAEAVVGLPEDLDVAPNRYTVEWGEATFHQVPLLDRDARLWGVIITLLPKVPVPAPPLDRANPGYPHVGRHGKEVLVVPVGRPDWTPRLRLCALQDDGKEDTHDYDAVRREQVKVCGGGRGRRGAMVGNEGLGLRGGGGGSVKSKLRGRSANEINSF